MIAASIIVLLCIYLLGAFPTGRLISQSYGVAIEHQGSGNVGATNVARVIGKRAGILTLAGDTLKGILGVELARLAWPEPVFPAIAAVLVVMGHCFSIPGRLKGGKGVATGLGITLALTPLAGVVCLVAFAGVFALSRLVSLASIVATISVPMTAFLINEPRDTRIGLCLVALIIILRHQENIQRLVKGEEKRFGGRV